MWDTIEAPQLFSEFQLYNFDIGLQSIGTDSEFETKKRLTDFSMKENNFTAMLENAAQLELLPLEVPTACLVLRLAHRSVAERISFKTPTIQFCMPLRDLRFL
jgi:hypothetical protein